MARRKAGNLAEILLWRELKNKKFLGFDFTRQATIGNFIVDFLCEAKKVIIEVDGSSHIGREDYDRGRDEYLWGAGYNVIRVSAENVKFNMEYVLRDIGKAMK